MIHISTVGQTLGPREENTGKVLVVVSYSTKVFVG